MWRDRASSAQSRSGPTCREGGVAVGPTISIGLVRLRRQVAVHLFQQLVPIQPIGRPHQQQGRQKNKRLLTYWPPDVIFWFEYILNFWAFEFVSDFVAPNFDFAFSFYTCLKAWMGSMRDAFNAGSGWLKPKPGARSGKGR